MPELTTGMVTCSACNRVVLTAHVNRSGRCSECAGLRQETIEARITGEAEPGELSPADADENEADT